MAPADRNIYGRHLAARVILAMQDMLSSGQVVTNRTIVDHIARRYDIAGKQQIKSLALRVQSITRELIRDGSVLYEEHKNSKRSTYYVFTKISSE